MLFDAVSLAKGWLSAALAASRDKDDSVLGFSVHIEQFPNGVRLTSCDRFLLLHTWVPNLAARDGEDEPAPDWDEAPMEVCAARDTYGRGRGLLAHLLKLATSDEDDPMVHEVRLHISKVKGPQGTLEGVSARDIILEHPDHEKVILPSNDATWPDWRGIVNSHERQPTDAIALHTERLDAIAKLAKYHEGAILWRFGGTDKAALLEVAGSRPLVTGVVMPIKWVFELCAEAEAA